MPKLIQQIRRSEGLITCNSCNRLLYVYEDAVAAPAAAPAGEPSTDPPATDTPAS
jgi:hypothetical protein